MDTLLEKVKANLILMHSADDALLKSYITAAVSYAESYQHIPEGFYKENPMPPTTEQAIIMERVVERIDALIPAQPKALRVCAYARVSTGKDAMLHSLSAQVSYYAIGT